jgi:hypothetical protein
VTPDDASTVALVAVVAIAPVAIVLIFAMLRGYTVTLQLHRPPRPDRRRRHGDDEGNGNDQHSTT